jgi:hypothetical protein
MAGYLTRCSGQRQDERAASSSSSVDGLVLIPREPKACLDRLHGNMHIVMLQRDREYPGRELAAAAVKSCRTVNTEPHVLFAVLSRHSGDRSSVGSICARPQGAELGGDTELPPIQNAPLKTRATPAGLFG